MEILHYHSHDGAKDSRPTGEKYGDGAFVSEMEPLGLETDSELKHDPTLSDVNRNTNTPLLVNTETVVNDKLRRYDHAMSSNVAVCCAAPLQAKTDVEVTIDEEREQNEFGLEYGVEDVPAVHMAALFGLQVSQCARTHTRTYTFTHTRERMNARTHAHTRMHSRTHIY
jgi:hypothetical protein